MIFVSSVAAEDWLNPGILLEAFEARAVRICVARAESLSKFPNPEEGMSFLLPLIYHSFGN